MPIAYGSTLEVEDEAGSGVFVKIAKITSIAKPNAAVDEVETTHMESPGRAKEFEAGLTDYGEVAYDIRWEASSATDLFIEAWRASGETRSVRATYGLGGPNDTFPAFVKGYEAGAGSPGDVFNGTLTLRCAGLPVRG